MFIMSVIVYVGIDFINIYNDNELMISFYINRFDDYTNRNIIIIIIVI